MTPPRLKPTLLAAAAALLLLAGCGSSSESTQSTPAQGSPPASTSSVPPSEAPVGVRATPCRAAVAGTSELRVTGVSCRSARATAAVWSRNPKCSSPAGASRTSCRLGRLTCLGAVTDRGVAVTCAEAGRSISFIGKRR